MSKQIPSSVAAICRMVLVIAVIDSFAITVLPQIPGCPPQITTPVLNYGWVRIQPGPKDVTVWVDPDFQSNGELGQVQAAITYWNGVGSSLCVPVHFTYTSNHEASDLSIVRFTTETNPNRTHMQPLDIDSVTHVLIKADIFIDIRDFDPSITSSYNTVIQKAVTHEIGHTMGLDHPPFTFKGRSIMNNRSGVNDSDNFVPLSLTACDRQSLSHNPQCPSPTPYPTPADDGCYIPPDTNTYPETGCPLGFTDVGEWCDRDEVYQSYCDMHDGYDFNTCICNDGFHPTPTPIPTPAPTPIIGYCGGQPYPDGSCASGFVNTGGTCTRSSTFISRCEDRFGGYDDGLCACNGGCGEGGGCSPIIVDVLGNGFALTSASNGVSFDIRNSGTPQILSWTTANSDDALLAFDRNGDGLIDSGRELFGNATPQLPPESGEELNGFRALALYDGFGYGGNGDGQITEKDAIFSRLSLWQDRNHNGVSESCEMFTLPQLGLSKLDLNYRSSPRIDQFGNEFRYRSKIFGTNGSQAARWAWDVFLVVQQ
jgi:hypothetical protein